MGGRSAEKKKRDPQMTEKFFCPSLCRRCRPLPRPFLLQPFLTREPQPEALTAKAIGAPSSLPPPPPPPPPPTPPLHPPTPVFLRFANWSHSESAGRKTKRDIPPFFPRHLPRTPASPPPRPHARSAKRVPSHPHPGPPPAHTHTHTPPDSRFRSQLELSVKLGQDAKLF